MLFTFKEYGKFAEITGYNNIKFALVEEFLKLNRKENQKNLDIQFFDAQLIATREHLYFAVLNSLQAFKNKTNISKSPAMETMLFASAQRQIQRAIQRCGIKPESASMAVVIIGEDPMQIEAALETITRCVGGKPDEKVLELSKVKEKRIREAFEISQEELNTVLKKENHFEAVVNLVIERVALLSTQL